VSKGHGILRQEWEQTCEFTLEDFRFRRLPLALACLEEVSSGVLKNVVRKQAIHYIFDVTKRRVDIWEERGNVIAGQACSNPWGRFHSEFVEQ